MFKQFFFVSFGLFCLVFKIPGFPLKINDRNSPNPWVVFGGKETNKPPPKTKKLFSPPKKKKDKNPKD